MGGAVSHYPGTIAGSEREAGKRHLPQYLVFVPYKMTRHLIAALAVGAALVMPAGPALATPSNAKDVQTYAGTCNDGSSLTIVVNAGQVNKNLTVQTWNPGFMVAGGTGHLLPTQFTFAGVDPTAGATEFSQTQTKGNTQAVGQGVPLTCTVDLGPQQGPDGTTLEGIRHHDGRRNARGWLATRSPALVLCRYSGTGPSELPISTESTATARGSQIQQ